MYSYAHLILFEQMVPFFFSLNRTKYFITRGKLFGPKKRLRPRLQFRQNVNCLLMESRTREQILTVTQLRTFCCSRGWTLPLKSQPQYRQAEVNTNYSLWRDLLQSPPSGPNLWCKHILMAQSDLQWSKICPGTAYKKCLQQKLYERFGRGLSPSPEMLRFALSSCGRPGGRNLSYAQKWSRKSSRLWRKEWQISISSPTITEVL